MLTRTKSMMIVVLILIEYDRRTNMCDSGLPGRYTNGEKWRNWDVVLWFILHVGIAIMCARMANVAHEP